MEFELNTFFAPALGIDIGKRGDVNDADRVRAAEPKYLVEALDKTLTRLKERAKHLQKSDMRITLLIGDLGTVQESIDRSSKSGKIGGPACFDLWCLFCDFCEPD